MNTYVSPCENPIAKAIEALCNSGYHEDTDGKEYYYEIGEKPGSFKQVFEDEVIVWSCGMIGDITPSNKIPVTFSC